MTSYLTGYNCNSNPSNYTTITATTNATPYYFLAHNVGSYYFRISGSKSNLKNATSSPKFTTATPVGTNYYIGQYTDDYTQQTFMITKKALTLTWETVAAKTYNGAYQEILAFSVLGLQGLDEVKLKIRFPAGMQMVEEMSGGGEAHVVENPTTVTPPNLTKDHIMNKNIASSSSYSIRARDAKTYTVTVLQLEGTHKDNYDFSTDSKEATISKKVLSFTWNDMFNGTSTYIYCKDYIGPKLSIGNIQSQSGTLDSIKLKVRLPIGVKFQTQIRASGSDPFVNTDIVSPVPTNAVADYETTTNVTNSTTNSFYRFLAMNVLPSGSTYKATIVEISGTHATNYTLTGASNLSRNLQLILKFNVTPSATETLTYNGQSQGVTLTVTSSDLYAGDTVTFIVPSQGTGSDQYNYSGASGGAVSKPDYTVSLNVHSFKGVYANAYLSTVGYRVVIYGSANPNYYFENVNGAISSTNPYIRDFVINQLKAGLTWGTLIFTYNGTTHTLTLQRSIIKFRAIRSIHPERWNRLYSC